MPRLLDKIDQLKLKFLPKDTASREEIFNWRSQAEKAELMLNLRDHEAMKRIIRQIEKDLEDMNVLLLTADSKKLCDCERDRIMDRKQLYIWFRNQFTDAENTAESLEKEVDRQLKHLSEKGY